MQCSVEEQIEENRRVAQERLSKTRLESPLKQLNKSYQSPLKSSPKPYGQEKPTTSTIQQFTQKDKVVTASCSLISEDQFTVVTSSFSNIIIDLFRQIPSRNYDPKSRNWNFNIKHYTLLLNKLLLFQPNVIVEKLPGFVLNCVNKPQKDGSSQIDLSRHLDAELFATLLPFQVRAVQFGIDRNGRCLLADDMGLGKTFQALAIANYYKENWPLLVVTTSSMKNVWVETIQTYLPSVPLMTIKYMSTGRDYIADCRIVIVSHDMMTRSIDKLISQHFGVIIVDESHTFKNSKAKCTKVACQLARNAKRMILLSGTPALSRPSELYTQLSMIDEKFFGTFFDYSRRYCAGKHTNFGWDATGKSNLQELEIILNRHFMIRRTKSEVLTTLPKKTQEVVTLDVDLNEFTEDDRKSLNALAAQYLKVTNGGAKHTALLNFFQETAKIKIPSVCSYILQVLNNKQKFLVFAHHQKMLDAIEKILVKKNVKFIRIDGHTTSEQRKYYVDKFQFDDNYLCALLSITAANAGITLTAGKLVLFAELHWNPSIISQAESRAHRIGQVEPVQVKYLLAKGTADDSIWPMLMEKQKILSEVGLCLDSFSDVQVTKQHVDNSESLTDNLNISRVLDTTSAHTMDIKTYFDVLDASNTSCVINMRNDDDMDCFNDGLDDVLGSLDL